MSNDASVSSVNYDSDNGYEVDSETESTPIASHRAVTPELSQTKVYYYFDKEETPYATIIDVPPSRLNLGQFKTKLARTNFKYYNYRPDSDGMDIKFEVKDDAERLQPSSKGVFTIYLLTDEQAGSDAPSVTAPTVQMRKSFTQQANRMSQNYKQNKQQPIYSLPRRCGSFRRLSPVDDSMREDTNFYPDVRPRAYSDESMLTDFTSVSQQRVRKRRQRKKYQPTRRLSPSFMSTTFSDASLCVDLVTCTFDLNTHIPLGLTVVTQSSPRGEDSGVYVSDITPNSLVARDGRIKRGMMILEVNDHQLSEMTTDQAINYLKESVSSRNGTIKLTCAQTERERFILPDETVLPINTGAWVHQTMAMRNKIQPIPEAYEPSPNANKLVFNPGCLNAGGFPSSGVGSSIGSETSFIPITNDTIHYQKLPQKRFKQQEKGMIAQAMASSCGESTKKCEKFASELVKGGFIVQVVSDKFSRETHYAFTDKTLNNRKVLAALNQQHPAMDETMVAPVQKGFAYKIKKFFCVHPPKHPSATSVGSSSVNRPPSDPVQMNENAVPNLTTQQHYQSHYYSTARQFPSTHIP
ncbi:hypothetical protein FO519_006831 [Halicephalobus sp. NKZ332]|nr:hypothetical protein FO519_006831 [Halicephalobus sp. NKZ332]